MKMSISQFQLAYDGEALRAGTMDVYELAPALLSVGDLVKDANRYLNSDRATVSVNVQSDFRRGSFEIYLVIDQSLIEQAKGVLFGAAVIDAKTIFETVFGAIEKGAKVVKGLISLYKILQGEAIVPGQVTITGNSVTIINSRIGEVPADANSASLYTIDAMRTLLERVLRPITKPGIDTLEVRQKKRVVASISKRDLPQRLVVSGSSEH